MQVKDASIFNWFSMNHSDDKRRHYNTIPFLLLLCERIRGFIKSTFMLHVYFKAVL
jgi:hypothetical protein